MDLKRRTFLQVAGLTAAGSALPGCEREVHRLIPYLLPDDEIVPGVDNWYASVCHECHAGCGIIVRTMEGRAKKIEGNPAHPVNQGKLCARGHAALQGLYNPDRIQGPLQRDGRRGDGRFKAITWEEGFAIWGEQLRTHAGRGAMVSRRVSGSLATLMSQFMHASQGRLVFYDPADSHSLRVANRRCFGVDDAPEYDIAHCDYLLSFGAPFLDQWLSPVSFGVAYGHMRQGRPTIRGRFVQVEPRLSLTAANADRWVPIKSGTEGLLALGIGQVMLHEGLTRLSVRGQQQYKPLYARHSLESIAQRTDVSRDEIIRLAREFAHSSKAIAIGGGSSCAQTNETMTLMAINALNLLVGNIGREGGVRFFRPAQFSASSDTSWTVSEQALSRLSEEFTQGRYSLLHLYRTNPLFAVPPSVPIQDMFDRADFIVSFSSFLDESTAMADLVLPDHSPLESWSDHVQHGVVATPAVSLGQPVVTPLHDTRAIGDVLLEALHRFMPAESHKVPAKDFYELIRARWRTFMTDGTADHGLESFESAWVQRLQQGGWWNEPEALLDVSPRPVLPDYRPAQFYGDEQQFPFYFHPYPSMTLGHGEGANLPWLQELPDTLTTAMWGTWIEINPQTARSYGVRQGELVKVISPYGSCEAPLVLFPGIRPDVIAMPIGQGHRTYGRYATDRGVNPLSLLAPAFDSESGALAMGSTRVRIQGTGRTGRLVLLEHGDKNGDELITLDRHKG